MDGQRKVINVTRDDVLDGARRGFRRTTFNNKCAPRVKFSGDGNRWWRADTGVHASGVEGLARLAYLRGARKLQNADSEL